MDRLAVIDYVEIPDGVEYIRVGRFFLKIHATEDSVLINDSIKIKDGGRE